MVAALKNHKAQRTRHHPITSGQHGRLKKKDQEHSESKLTRRDQLEVIYDMLELLKQESRDHKVLRQESHDYKVLTKIT